MHQIWLASPGRLFVPTLLVRCTTGISRGKTKTGEIHSESLHKYFQGLYELRPKQPSRGLLYICTCFLKKAATTHPYYFDAQYSKQARNRRLPKMNSQLYFLVLIAISNYGTTYGMFLPEDIRRKPALLHCKEDDQICLAKDAG